MTYRRLLEILSALDEKSLDQDVIVHQAEIDEYWKISSTDYAGDTDVIDFNHFILVF